MTLPAVDTWAVRGLKGEKYKVGPRCAAPGCTHFAEHAHHIVRRTALGGDFPWVEIEGKVYGNLTGLCPGHHDDVTGRVGGHKAAIRLDEDGVFWWTTPVTGTGGEITYFSDAPLDPQPPTPETLATRATGTHSASEQCPFCGHRNRRRSSALPPRGRRRKTWLIKVPDDEEDGAGVLDALVDDLSPIFGYSDDPNARYYTVVRALVHAQQDRGRLAQSIEGRGG